MNLLLSKTITNNNIVEITRENVISKRPAQYTCNL